MVDDLFKSLDKYKGEWMEDIKHGDGSSASLLDCVEECISERESRRFDKSYMSSTATTYPKKSQGVLESSTAPTYPRGNYIGHFIGKYPLEY